MNNEATSRGDILYKSQGDRRSIPGSNRWQAWPIQLKCKTGYNLPDIPCQIPQPSLSSTWSPSRSYWRAPTKTLKNKFFIRRIATLRDNQVDERETITRHRLLCDCVDSRGIDRDDGWCLKMKTASISKQDILLFEKATGKRQQWARSASRSPRLCCHCAKMADRNGELSTSSTYKGNFQSWAPSLVRALGTSLLS